MTPVEVPPLSSPLRASPSRLNPEQRAGALRRLAGEVFDVAIIGGGVTGCGAALDAVTRGLSVALVEKRDLSAGTSSRSSKLIHGGLRYLEQLHFGLVREARREQALLLGTLCPHLVRPVPFLFPLTHRVWERAYVGAGVWIYDHLAGRRVLPRHRHLSRASALREFRALRGDTLTGAIQYWDAEIDDARHTMTLARTAAPRASGFLSRGIGNTRGRALPQRPRLLGLGQARGRPPREP